MRTFLNLVCKFVNYKSGQAFSDFMANGYDASENAPTDVIAPLIKRYSIYTYSKHNHTLRKLCGFSG